MKELELIKKTFSLEETPRIPWVPFIGCHAAHLIGVAADEYLQSPDLIVKGVAEAIRRYKPDGIPVMFDLQVEAEALGCQLRWAKDNPPAVVSHPFTNLDTLKPLKGDEGRIPMILDATREIRAKYPGIALYGLITGPFTLAMHLFGTDLFMKLYEDIDHVHELMKFTTRVGEQMSEWYLDAGCDVIAVVDPMTSQIDPGTFETFVTPGAISIFNNIRKKGGLSSFFVCGHAQQNIEVMCKCKPDNISIDENIPLDYVKDVALSREVSFGGNMKLTSVLLMGSVEDTKYEALDCMEKGGKRGFVLAPGCDLAMATPPENIEAVGELVHDEYQQQVLRTMERKVKETVKLDLTNHWKNNKVVIDIITLDSSSCAPCQYMVEAVEHAANEFDDKVIYQEHRIKEEDGIRMMQTLGVQNLPTICIDGNIEFISRIPPRKILVETIAKYLQKKEQV
ncbi:MAG: uroporphyrinogen decarboxylase family protein [Bacteroidota bacterium]